MSAFDLLSEPIRRYIWRQKWEELRPIQTAAIQRILSTDLNYILSAKTASGKTEAAFLPIISRYDQSIEGVQVLYISPLIALINDQFERIEALCKDLEIRVTKWHGEAERAAKDNLIETPEGILLITPESIESLFVNKSYVLSKLFGNLRFIVIDELHSFLSSDRGVHLLSLIHRIRDFCPSVRLIGLSATLGDTHVAKRYLSTDSEAHILNDPSQIQADIETEFLESNSIELSQEVMERISDLTKGHRTLVFPNSRGRVEEIAVKLKKLHKTSSKSQPVFSHHSSVDKESKEFAEKFAKNSVGKPFTIVCTSTLELGIDIGQIDGVIQVDSTHSVSSLAQRLGRSGRRGQRARLNAVATNPWTLLESLACVKLYQSGLLEPHVPKTRPFNVVAHQILSILSQVNGCSRELLLNRLINNKAFSDISLEEHIELLDFMIDMSLIEKSDREIILGIEGEKLKLSKDFYGLFKAEKGMTVYSSNQRIGDVPDSAQVQENENLFLGAKIWKIVEVDRIAQKILVTPTSDGRKPIYFGSAVDVSPLVRQQMFNLLTSELSDITAWKPYLSEPMQCVSGCSIIRLIRQKEQEAHFYLFASTRISRTIELTIRELSSAPCRLNDSETRLESSLSAQYLQELLNHIAFVDDTKTLFSNLNNAVLNPRFNYLWPKFFEMVPDKLRVEWLLSNAFDFSGMKNFLSSVQIQIT